MNFELIIALIFYLIIGLIIYKNKKKIEVMDKLFFVYKWKRGVNYLKKIAKCDWFWKILITIGIPICFIGIVFSINMLLNSLIVLFNSSNPISTVQLFIPGITKNPTTGKVFPLFQSIMAIMILVVVHEGMHGIISIVEKIKLKSVGIGMFLFLPLAFVEPYENSLRKASLLSRIRVYVAGSFGNILLALLLFLIISFVLFPTIYNTTNFDVLISKTIEGFPANLSGVPNNSTIIALNSVKINNLTQFNDELNKVKVNDSILLETNNGNYSFNVTSNPDNISKPYLGVLINQRFRYKDEFKKYPNFISKLLIFLVNFLELIMNLSFSIGIFNLYPLWITDGGKVIYELINKIIKNKKLSVIIINIIFLICLIILLLNLFGSYFI